MFFVRSFFAETQLMERVKYRRRYLYDFSVMEVFSFMGFEKNENFLFFIFESIEILIIVIIAEVILMLFFFFLNHYHIDVNYTTSKQY